MTTWNYSLYVLVIVLVFESLFESLLVEIVNRRGCDSCGINCPSR